MGLGRHQRRADHHRWPSSGTAQGRDYPRKRKPSASGSERRRRIRSPGEIRFSGVQAMSASGTKRTSLVPPHIRVHLIQSPPALVCDPPLWVISGHFAVRKPDPIFVVPILLLSYLSYRCRSPVPVRSTIETGTTRPKKYDFVVPATSKSAQMR